MWNAHYHALSQNLKYRTPEVSLRELCGLSTGLFIIKSIDVGI